MIPARVVLLILATSWSLLAAPAAGQAVGPAPTEATARIEPSVATLPGAEPVRPELALNPLRVLSDAGGLLTGASDLGAALRPPAPPQAAAGSAAPDGPGLSVAINIMLLLTVVTLVPSIMLMTTGFVRIMVVFALLRQALGTQSVPPAQVITGLALFMTAMVMKPTIDRVWEEAVVPYQTGEIRSVDVLWERGSQPLRDFMFDQIEATGNWSSLYMVLNYQGVDTSEPQNLVREDIPTTTLVPAYMLSELKTAFLMGFRVYLPFLVIDMVIASLLISMSMMMLPPVLISLPFKLMLFVLVDGWTLIVGSLLDSFVVDGAGNRASAVTAMMLCCVAWPVRRGLDEPRLPRETPPDRRGLLRLLARSPREDRP
jgi:flagellar biosynthetic protein FliP